MVIVYGTHVTVNLELFAINIVKSNGSIYRTNASVERKMSRGKVAQKQNQKGKVKLVEDCLEKNAKDKDKVDAKDKVDEMRGLVLSQVQEEGLKRAFARKAILSPRFVKLLLEKL